MREPPEASGISMNSGKWVAQESMACRGNMQDRDFFFLSEQYLKWLKFVSMLVYLQFLAFVLVKLSASS